MVSPNLPQAAFRPGGPGSLARKRAWRWGGHRPQPAPVDREALIRWFETHRRDLPWRRTSDPYAKWVAEVMLQQTRVDTVVPYYERFLARFPTVRDLADADPDSVRALWSGLGYYRRAQLMLAAARRIVHQHGGRLPPDARALRALPGFGPYMTGAVGSMAFDLPLPAVDGNVTRVLSRLHAIEGPTDTAGHRRQVQQRAAEWAAKRPAAVNEALIELGATVCTPRTPRCPACPLQRACAGRDRAHELPPPKRRAAPKTWTGHGLVVQQADGPGIWLEQRGREGLFRELWCVPLVADATPPAGSAWIETVWPGLGRAEVRGRVVHVLTHRRLELTVWFARAAPDGTRPVAGRWVDPRELDRWGTPALVHKILKVALPPLFR